MTDHEKPIKTSVPDEMRQDAVGARLKILRKSHGLRQADIAEMLDIERNYWSRWETGTRPIPPEKAYLLTKIFAIDLDWILAGDMRSVPMEMREKLTSRDVSA